MNKRLVSESGYILVAICKESYVLSGAKCSCLKVVSHHFDTELVKQSLKTLDELLKPLGLREYPRTLRARFTLSDDTEIVATYERCNDYSTTPMKL